MDGSKIVSSAILGYDVKTVFIAGKPYTIKPPTIRTIAGVGYWLANLPEGNSIADMMRMCSDFGHLARAASFLIAGDESLSDELMAGTLDEVIDAIGEGLALISTANFMKLSSLRKSVRALIAKQNS